MNRRSNEFHSARRAFERWRESRASGSRIPEDLWSAAVALARKHGVSKTSLELRLDYYALKDRLEAGAAERTGSEEDRPRFVEIVAGATKPTRGCILEIEDRRRARLRIELSGEATLQVERVARALWSAAR